MNQCNICSCDFSLDDEGGIDGYIGMLYFSLCPTCFSGIVDMCDQLREGFEDADE